MTKTIDLSDKYLPTDRQTIAHTCPETYVLYGGAVGGGKSAWLVNEALQLSLDYPGNVGYLCRHELASFRRTTLLELQKFLPDDLISQHHGTESFYRLKNGSMIYYGGLGDDQRAIDRLKSMTLGWWGIDQAEETSESFFFLLASRLRLVLPGIIYKGLMTANPAPGWLKHRFIEQVLEDHIFIPALPKDNPHLPPTYESNLRKIYPAELVKQLLEGDWDTLEAGKFLFRYIDIKNAINRKFYTSSRKSVLLTKTEVGDLASPTRRAKSEYGFQDYPIKMGVDIAAGGEDISVATIKRGDRVEHIDSWIDPNTMASCGKIINLMEKFEVDPSNVNIDAIGIGKGVFDRLIEQGYPVNGVIAGGQADDNEHYANIKAEAYFQLAKRFEDGLISIPDNTNLISQLSTIRYDVQSDKRMTIVSKEIMKNKYRVKSPDYADSLMLAFAEVEPVEVRVRWI